MSLRCILYNTAVVSNIMVNFQIDKQALKGLIIIQIFMKKKKV